MIPRFRLFDKSTNKMIEHFLIGSNGLIYTPHSKKFEQYKNGSGIPFYRGDDNSLLLMQSTQLFDKNGVEIFEGDIIDTTDYEGGLSSVGNPLIKIERDNYGFIVSGDFPDSPVTLKDYEDGRKYADVEVSVIGNIYENKDLVEVLNDTRI